MSSIYVLKKPKNAAVYIVPEDELRWAKLSYRYDFSFEKNIVGEDLELVGTELVYVYRECAIKSAVENASMAHYADFKNDTWVVDNDGTVIARVAFSTQVDYL